MIANLIGYGNLISLVGKPDNYGYINEAQEGGVCMNPYDENQFLSDDEQFQIIDNLFDEDDSEDESRSEFYSTNA